MTGACDNCSEVSAVDVKVTLSFRGDRRKFIFWGRKKKKKMSNGLMMRTDRLLISSITGGDTVGLQQEHLREVKVRFWWDSRRKEKMNKHLNVQTVSRNTDDDIISFRGAEGVKSVSRTRPWSDRSPLRTESDPCQKVHHRLEVVAVPLEKKQIADRRQLWLWSVSSSIQEEEEEEEDVFQPDSVWKNQKEKCRSEEINSTHLVVSRSPELESRTRRRFRHDTQLFTY